MVLLERFPRETGGMDMLESILGCQTRNLNLFCCCFACSSRKVAAAWEVLNTARYRLLFLAAPLLPDLGVCAEDAGKGFSVALGIAGGDFIESSYISRM